MSLYNKWISSYPRESYVLIIASFTNAIGSAMLWPLTTIYVHNVLHRSYGEAGFVLFCQSLAGVLGQFVGGALFHKIGAKWLIVGSLILAGLAQFGLIFTKDWVPYIAMMAVNGFLNAVTMPAVNAFIGFRWRAQRYRLFNAVYVCNNVGVALGTVVAGLLAAISFNLTFFMDGITTLGFGVFFYFFLKRIPLGETEDLEVHVGLQSDQSSVWRLLLDYRLYFFVAIGTMALTMATSAWSCGIAPFLNDQGMSPAWYSSLWTVNGIVILIGQPLMSLLNRMVMKTMYTRLVGSAVFYTVGFAFIMMLHGAYMYLLLGMLVCTFGEMLISPTSPTLITQTTGKSAPFYLGIVGGIGNLGRLLGPLIFGSLFDVWGVSPILVISTGMAVLGTLSFCLHHSLRIHPKSETLFRMFGLK